MEVNTVLQTKKAGEFLIRQLTEADIPIVQQLCVECSDFHMLSQGSKPSDHEGADIMRDCPPGKSPEDKVLFGMFSPEEQLEGVVELLSEYPEKDSWYIGLMMLKPSRRGVGLGRELLAWVEQYLAANNVRALCLAVLAVNPRGRKFWEVNGFKQVRQVDNYQSGNISTTAFVMQKAI